MISHEPRNINAAFYSPGRIGHIAKLEPLKKQEIKQYIQKMIQSISEDTLKACMSSLATLSQEHGGGSNGMSIASISDYIQRYGGECGTGLLLPENIKRIVEQSKLRKEILQLHSDKMYS